MDIIICVWLDRVVVRLNFSVISDKIKCSSQQHGPCGVLTNRNTRLLFKAMTDTWYKQLSSKILNRRAPDFIHLGNTN